MVENKDNEEVWGFGCFDSMFSRESKRFMDSTDVASRVITQLLIADTKSKEEMDASAVEDIHLFCRFGLKIFLGFLSYHLENFYRSKKEDAERSPYNIYSSGIRRLVTRLEVSQLAKKFVPFFKLGDVFELLKVYKDQVSDFLKYFESFSKEFEVYMGNLDDGGDIVESTDKGVSDDEKEENDYTNHLNARLYASIKTWPEETDFSSFIEDFEKLLETGVEITILSPIQLYLKLGKDGITIIWKALISNLEEINDNKKVEFKDLKEFSDHLYDSIKEESKQLGMLYEIDRLFKETVRQYVESFKDDQNILRSLVKGKNKRKRFVENFERRVYTEEE